MRIFVVKSTGWHHVEVTSLLHTFYLILLSFGAHWDHLFVFKTSAGHSALILLLLQSRHDLVLLDSTEVVFVGDANIGIDYRLSDCFSLPDPIEVRGSPWSLLFQEIKRQQLAKSKLQGGHQLTCLEEVPLCAATGSSTIDTTRVL